MTRLGDFAPRSLAVDVRDRGEDRVTHGIECLRNQRRTDDAARIARAERDRSAATTLRWKPARALTRLLFPTFGAPTTAMHQGAVRWRPTQA